MPLKDRDQKVPRRLVRLGIIRLGHRVEKTRPDGTVYQYPTQDDHFVLDDAADLLERYGPAATELDVLLPFPDVRRNFDGAYTVWAGGVLVCRGDGEFVEYAAPFTVTENKSRVAVRNAEGDTLVNSGMAARAFKWNGAEFQTGDHVPCPGGGVAGRYPHCAACKKTAMLKVMCADPQVFRFGFYQLVTGSGRNYDTILGTLELIHEHAGKVSGIPFTLRMVKEKCVYTTGGQRKQGERYFLQLEPAAALVRALYAKQADAILAAPQLAATVAASQDEGEQWEEPVDTDPEAPPPAAENVEATNGEPENEDDQGAESNETPADAPAEWPDMWGAYVKKALEELGYKDTSAVAKVLKAAGYKTLVDGNYKITFSPAEGWAALLRAQQGA